MNKIKASRNFLVTQVLKTTMIARICLIGICLCGASLAQTSADNPRLKAALERYPAADSDRDGILTLEEANDFKNKRSRKKGQSGAVAPTDGERHIYKKVGTTELPLYVYSPKNHSAKANSPAIVFFFGGGWSSGSPAQFEQQCKYLAGRGMVAVTAEYRVASRHPVLIDDCIEDAKSAMRWVRGNCAELGVDPERIASSGGSAGGHLAACVTLMEEFNASADDLKISAKSNAMVLFNPPMALAPDENLSKTYLARIDHGDERTKAGKDKISPLTYASTKQPPCIMFFGTADTLLEGAQVFQKESENSGNTCKLLTYDGQGHGFFNHGARGGKYYDLTLAETARFLVDLGWLKQK